ncbi:hypothetical protein OV090_06725 [Nannocystis sp. RBIL2]|uniref:hypothetical protein n=1 Tax=Nannocystis sp. RBIL2 TaxID=2996788 RepID=UPI00226EC4D3|nr:hypothetical protein [Nannocystis sp. RBIL2]MCY1064446.1 hypothetical protein [Nannocystis sp. RBIL2]
MLVGSATQLALGSSAGAFLSTPVCAAILAVSGALVPHERCNERRVANKRTSQYLLRRAFRWTTAPSSAGGPPAAPSTERAWDVYPTRPLRRGQAHSSDLQTFTAQADSRLDRRGAESAESRSSDREKKKFRSFRPARGPRLLGLLVALVMAPRASHAAPAEADPAGTIDAYVARATELFQQAEDLKAKGDRKAARHYHEAARAAAAALERLDHTAPHYLVYAQTLASRVVRSYKNALLLLDHPLLWNTARTWCATSIVATLDPGAGPRLAEVRAWCDALPPSPSPPPAGSLVYDPWTGIPSPPSPPSPPNPTRRGLVSAADTALRVAESRENPFFSSACNDRNSVFLPTAPKQ